MQFPLLGLPKRRAFRRHGSGGNKEDRRGPGAGESVLDLGGLGQIHLEETAASVGHLDGPGRRDVSGGAEDGTVASLEKPRDDGPALLAGSTKDKGRPFARRLIPWLD